MPLASERREGALILKASGRLDSARAEGFEEQLKEAVGQEDQTVILDLEDVEFMNSAGLRIALLTAKELDRAGRRFAVCALSEQVSAVFKISGFDKIIAVYDSTQDAIDSFS